jgi:hypothetical protein
LNLFFLLLGPSLVAHTPLIATIGIPHEISLVNIIICFLYYEVMVKYV